MSTHHTVVIEKIIPGGLGLARMADGLVVMVPLVLPGERVVVDFLKDKRGYVDANLVEVIEASPERIEPPCPYYGRCGGCDFQHIAYAAQLEIKQQILKQQLSKTLTENSSWQQTACAMLEAQEPFAYRQRVRFQVDGRGNMGFFGRRSHDIVPVSCCLLATPLINSVFAELSQDTNAKILLKNSEAVELIFDQRGEKVITVFHFTRKPRATDISSAKKIAQLVPGVQSLLLKTSSWGNLGPFYGEQILDASDEAVQNLAGQLCFTVHLADGKSADMLLEAGGFCQVNAKQNDKLIQRVLAWANISAETTILDLYCGLGNFSIPAAFYGKYLLGLDLQRSAIRSARQNALENGLVNCTFQQESAFSGAKKIAASSQSFDLVLLDPPRSGCKEIMPFIEKIAADQIIYISCDPATLARDLALLAKYAFQIEKIQGIDMFPQTHHIETIVHLKKVYVPSSEKSSPH